MSMLVIYIYYVFFFFNDTATTEIYTLSLHDALPISEAISAYVLTDSLPEVVLPFTPDRFGETHRSSVHRSEPAIASEGRSEEHTSELQSRSDLVCRLLLEKKKNITNT